MTQHDIFVATEHPAAVVSAVIEAALGVAFQPSQGPDPVPALMTGGTKVFFHDSHPFEDDAEFPVSRYQYWVSVEDSARDEQRQLEIARRVFEAVTAEGWPAMLSLGLQGNVVIYP